MGNYNPHVESQTVVQDCGKGIQKIANNKHDVSYYPKASTIASFLFCGIVLAEYDKLGGILHESVYTFCRQFGCIEVSGFRCQE